MDLQILSTEFVSMTHYVSRAAGLLGNRWLKWIANDDGNETIDGDADGVFTGPNRILIDLSHALSQRLGRQMSMMSVYKVDYIKIELINRDDVNDNDSGLQLSGQAYYWGPSKHRIDAMQMARQLETATESVHLDQDSFLLSTERDYKGMRFNWDNDGQVTFATAEGFDNLQGGEWDMQELFTVYGGMQDLSSQFQNALWSDRCGSMNNFAFDMSYVNHVANGDTDGFDPESRPFTLPNAGLEVLGGLMMLDITHSSTDSPLNVIDDDYEVRVTVGIDGWSDF